MLAEFLDRLRALSVASADAKFLAHPENPREVYLVHGDTNVRQELPPPLRRHSIGDFESLTSALCDDQVCSDPEIWVQHDRVHVICDRGDRRDLLTWELSISDRWRSIARLFGGRHFTPREAISFLRFEVASEAGDRLIAAIRRLDFKRSNTGAHVIEHGRESLGRQVEAKVQRADEIPETVTVSVPYWAHTTPECIARVEIGIELDPTNESIVLRLLPDQITAVERSAARIMRAAILGHDLVSDLTSACFIGRFFGQ